MPTEFHIEDAEASIIAALAADAGVQALKAQVQAFTDQHLDQDGNIVVNAPAILPVYDATVDTQRPDNTCKTYETYHNFAVLCISNDLTSTDAERKSGQQLVAAVRKAMAGARLSLDAGAAKTLPVMLNGVERVQFDNNGVVYAVKIRVPAVAQFG